MVTWLFLRHPPCRHLQRPRLSLGPELSSDCRGCWKLPQARSQQSLNTPFSSKHVSACEWL